MTEKTTIEGLDELVKNLREFSGDLKGNPLRNASRAMANIVKEAAIQKAAVSDDGTKVKGGEDIPPGRLKRAIRSRLVPLRLRDAATLRGDSVEVFDIDVKPGRSRDDPKGAYYWWFVENGTEKQPAQPFLRPAFYENETKLEPAFAKKLRRSIELAAKRRANRTRMLMKGHQ